VESVTQDINNNLTLTGYNLSVNTINSISGNNTYVYVSRGVSSGYDTVSYYRTGNLHVSVDTFTLAGTTIHRVSKQFYFPTITGFTPTFGTRYTQVSLSGTTLSTVNRVYFYGTTVTGSMYNAPISASSSLITVAPPLQTGSVYLALVDNSGNYATTYPSKFTYTSSIITTYNLNGTDLGSTLLNSTSLSEGIAGTNAITIGNNITTTTINNVQYTSVTKTNTVLLTQPLFILNIPSGTYFCSYFNLNLCGTYSTGGIVNAITFYIYKDNSTTLPTITQTTTTSYNSISPQVVFTFSFTASSANQVTISFVSNITSKSYTATLVQYPNPIQNWMVTPQ
jgi:hypothetical protein